MINSSKAMLLASRYKYVYDNYSHLMLIFDGPVPLKSFFNADEIRTSGKITITKLVQHAEALGGSLAAYCQYDSELGVFDEANSKLSFPLASDPAEGIVVKEATPSWFVFLQTNSSAKQLPTSGSLVKHIVAGSIGSGKDMEFPSPVISDSSTLKFSDIIINVQD